MTRKMTDFDQDAFDLWLEANTPGGRVELDPSMMFLATALAVTPVLSSSALTGSNAQQALQLDSAYSSAEPSEAVEKLQQSPATGCTMLLTLAREKSGYDPTLPAQTGSVQKFLSYVNQVLLCPLFGTILNDHIAPEFSGNWNNVINQIASYYVGIPEGDIDTLKQSLNSIAAAASSNPSTDETLNMFSQATLNVDRNNIDVYMYHTYVQMKTTIHSGGKHEPDKVSNQAFLSLYRVHLSFNSAEWPRQAANVHQQTEQSLSDWLANNSTPTGSLPANWHPS